MTPARIERATEAEHGVAYTTALRIRVYTHVYAMPLLAQHRRRTVRRVYSKLAQSTEGKEATRGGITVKERVRGERMFVSA